MERPPGAKPGAGGCSGNWLSSRDDCKNGRSHPPFRIFGGLSVAPGLEPVPGPAAVPIVRLGGLIGQRPELAFEDRADSLEPTKQRPLSRFIAPTIDVPAIGTSGEGSVSPFLGGGLGTVRTGSGETGASFPETGPFLSGASKVGTAWMVTAGVTATLNPRTTLELAWRYNYLGKAKTGRSSGRVEWRQRGRPIPTNLAPTSVEAKYHGLRLSLRYGF